MNEIIIPTWSAPSKIRAFTTTRNTDLSNLQLPNEPVLLELKHTNLVVEGKNDLAMTQADAVFTFEKNTVLRITTADCLPLFISDQKGSFVALIHAGWKGLSLGIIKNTVEKLPENRESFLVWIGPCISQNVYEVGQDVYDAFLHYSSNAEKVFKPANQPNKYFADLSQFAIQQFNDLGIQNIIASGECTYSNPDKYFSYRRNKEQGRLQSFIWIS